MIDNISLINFTQLNQKQKEMILTWRNSPKIKKWMFNSKEITIHNHLKFINLLNVQNDKLYFLLKKESIYIGVLSFTGITDEDCKIGIYANPELKRVGDTLMKTALNFAFNKLHLKNLIAEVFSDNLRAIKLYKRYNFKEIDKKQIQDRELISMELKNENR
jgi:UDP-4-amino-4,6-dideoxy-N-acetyl-beta-L-altrosamine N-acetyltransferase